MLTPPIVMGFSCMDNARPSLMKHSDKAKQRRYFTASSKLLLRNKNCTLQHFYAALLGGVCMQTKPGLANHF
ncbi:hypothetical protein [Undibacterium sp. Ren11W]|uniref:hypothetical protein n=1 Tax=Undibacterium sp. Ren11W TaxID=3413045 RepID=UPI003BF0BF7E